MATPWSNQYILPKTPLKGVTGKHDVLNQPNEIRFVPIAPISNNHNQLNRSNHVSEKKRVRRACDQCKHKKIKCQIVEGSNSCRKCIQCNKQCTFNIGLKKRGPPRGYISVLEDRLKRIESLISGISVERNKSIELNDNETTSSIFEDQQQNDSNSDEDLPKKKHKIEESCSDKEDILFDHLQLVNHLNTEGRYISENSVAKLIFSGKLGLKNKKELFSRYGLDIQHNKISDYYHIKRSATVDDHRNLQIHELISNNIIKPNETITNIDEWVFKVSGIQKSQSDRLLKIYFAYIHPLLPVVNKVEFLEQYRGVRSIFPSGDLLNAIFGAAIRYIENCKKFGNSDTLDDGGAWDIPEGLSDLLFKKLILFIKGKYAPRLSTIQAIIIAHNHCANIDNWTSGWLLNCIAVRMSQDIGLHRSAKGWNISEQEKETRRMVWWCAYILDRWFSAGSGRPLTIFDEDCDEVYPSENISLDEAMDIMTENDQHLPRFPSLDEHTAKQVKDNMVPLNEPFVQIVKLSEILGLILQSLYTPKAKKHSAKYGSDAVVGYLDNALSKWKNALPPLLAIAINGENPVHSKVHNPLLSMSGLISLCYFTLLILLHRPFIENSTNNDHLNEKSKLSSQSSLAICTSAANRIVEVAESMNFRDFLLISWGFALYPVFTAALIHTYNCSSKDPNVANVAKSNLVRALAVLDKLCLLSPMASDMGVVLKQVISVSPIFVNDPEFVASLNQHKKRDVTQPSIQETMNEIKVEDDIKEEAKKEMMYSSPDNRNWLNQLYTPQHNQDRVKTSEDAQHNFIPNQVTTKNEENKQEHQLTQITNPASNTDPYSIQKFGFNMNLPQSHICDLHQQHPPNSLEEQHNTKIQAEPVSSSNDNMGIQQTKVLSNTSSQPYYPSKDNSTCINNSFNPVQMMGIQNNPNMISTSNNKNMNNNDFILPTSYPDNFEHLNSNINTSMFSHDFMDFLSPGYFGSQMFDHTPFVSNSGLPQQQGWTSEQNIPNQSQYDPSALFRHNPGNPFWSIPSSMEIEDWAAYLLPHQQQQHEHNNN